jgi:hypothetical protein
LNILVPVWFQVTTTSLPSGVTGSPAPDP